MLQETTHESTIRNWFTLETMPSAWKAADPIGCEALVQALQDKMLKAYNMGLLDGAARRKIERNADMFEAECELSSCYTYLLETEYVAQSINHTFTPIWRGDMGDSRKGAAFINQMNVATGLVVTQLKQAIKALQSAQIELGLMNDETKTENTVSVA